MARETKMQRLAREEREWEEAKARREELVAQWPGRLMMNLGRAQKLGWDLSVDGNFFVLDTFGEQFRLTPKAPDQWELEQQMVMLEWELGIQEAAAGEEQRREVAKQAALDKLTDTEKELLGLDMKRRW